MAKDEIVERKRRRFVFLQALYNKTKDNRFESADIGELTRELGYERDEVYTIIDYLHEEHLVRAFGGGTIRIEHLGIVEVEEALSKPDQPTEHFPAINIMHVEQMINSRVQQGTMHSIQSNIIEHGDLQPILDVVLRLKAVISDLNLKPEDRKEFEAEIATIESQKSSSHPKAAIIKECLHSLRRILEGAGGGILASQFAQEIAKLLTSSF